jgi:SAM-dependent methyltransferase
MRDFVEKFVVPILKQREWTRVCEIGVSYGYSTDYLASLPGVYIIVIDPCLDCDLERKYADVPQVSVKKGTSLDELPRLNGFFDCILIDGDHNWYTVYHELKIIFDRDLLKPGGIIFFHDVEWPYGRRDMYYRPEMIPAEHRHTCEKKGIVRGQGELSAGAYNSQYWNATREGGPRNGVLTAIEDFLRDHASDYSFYRVRGEYGLGMLYRRKHNLRDDLSFLSVECKAAAYNIVTWPKRSTKENFPGAVSLAKSILRRA